MVKRLVITSVIILTGYVSFLSFKLWVGMTRQAEVAEQAVIQEESHKVYSFSFSKYDTAGKKELEIEGDTGNILARTVSLDNVIAKAYADETPVTITADQGVFDKSTNTAHLQRNVVATTQEGGRLLSDSLNIHPAEKSLDTKDKAFVRKDNIDVQGLGAAADSHLKKVKFHKNVTVVIQTQDSESPIPTVITCDGPLDIDYDHHIARFYKDVVATDHRGKLSSDRMDVYYNEYSKKVEKIVAMGNVVITTPEGNATYGDEVTYFAQEGRILIGGSTETIYFPGTGSRADESLLFGEGD
jgi:LPS export ABC transporter protein LptC